LFLPFLLLRGDPSPIWRVPFEVRNAVFAEVRVAPEALSLEQISLELLKTLTKNS
jgi:hypothetical protein